jgi:hypothetical protein
MKTGYFLGAMVAKLEPGDVIDPVPVPLGDGMLHPGEFVARLGEKKRSSFEMEDGYFLRYEGRIGNTLLFGVNDLPADEWYYAFEYIAHTTLILGGRRGCWDIEIRHQEKVAKPEFAPPKPEQLTLF